MRFGISTHLYHDQRLGRQHLEEIASFGFEAIELFATRSHFDYHDEAAIAQLEEWLRATGLTLHGVHAPITESFVDGKWGRSFSTAATDGAERQAAVREATLALGIARRIPAGVVVLHLGIPKGQQPSGAGDNSRDAARRSVEEIHAIAAPLGVRLAVEVIPNALSEPDSLVKLLEEELDLDDAGICLDFGHAHLLGDVVDAIEVAGGHVITTHIHDNRGQSDDHLVPFEGAIDWALALMALQKIGYEGTMLMEIANTSGPAEVLDNARRARRRFDQILRAPIEEGRDINFGLE